MNNIVPKFKIDDVVNYRSAFYKIKSVEEVYILINRTRWGTEYFTKQDLITGGVNLADYEVDHYQYDLKKMISETGRISKRAMANGIREWYLTEAMEYINNKKTRFINNRSKIDNSLGKLQTVETFLNSQNES